MKTPSAKRGFFLTLVTACGLGQLVVTACVDDKSGGGPQVVDASVPETFLGDAGPLPDAKGPGDDGPDSATSDDSGVLPDSAGDGGGGSCLGKPFGAPVGIWGAPTTSDDRGARLSPDELTMYFASDRPLSDGGAASWEIYVATRASKSVPFDPPTHLDSLTSPAQDMDPVLTNDGLTILFSSFRAGATRYDLYQATRANVGAPFGAPIRDLVLSTALDEREPYLNAAGDRMYFVSSGHGAVANDIFVTPYPIADAGPITPVGGVNAAGVISDDFPVLTTDELTIYFRSGRPPAIVNGGFIQMATRASVGDPFGPPSLVTELNDGTDAAPTWVSPDGCTLYFQRDRQIQRATRGE